MPNDPLTGGVALRRPAIASPNFNEATQTGWSINADGSAFFFNVTAFGSITASTVVVDGATGGVFIYSGAPALGNLIGSWAGQAGADTFGNSYPQGLNVTTGIIAGSTISGSVFKGTEFILNTSGFFLYSGTPASGNLIYSVAAANGSDSFGNSYNSGLQIGNQSGAHFAVNTTGSLFVANSSNLVVFTQRSSDGSALYYNSSGVGAGNLIASIAPAAGTDASGNKFYAGVTSYGGGASSPVTNIDAGTINLGATQTQVNNNLGGLIDNTVAGALQMVSGGTAAADDQLVLNLLSSNNSSGTYPSLLVVDVNGSGAAVEMQAGTTSPGASHFGAILWVDGNDRLAFTTTTDMIYRVASSFGTQQGGNTNNTTSLNNLTDAYNIEANDAKQGTVYRLTCGGHGTQATGSAVALNFQLEAFGIAWGNSGDTGGVAAGDAFHWRFVGELIIGGNGSSVGASFFGTMVISQATASAAGHATSMDKQVTSGVNTTAVTQISFQAGWASITGSPTIVCTGALVERLGA